MGDWSGLPYDVLTTILQKLDALEEFVCFSAVCRSWNCAFLMVKELLNASLRPWLLLAENTTKENPECLRKVYCPANNRCFQLKLPETFGRRCWGLAYGWLVTIGLGCEMHLFNPLTKARLALPDIFALADAPPFPSQLTSLRVRYVRRAFVVQINVEVFVLVTYDEWNQLALARPGDPSWTRVEAICNGMNSGVLDFCRWDGKVLVVFGDGTIGRVDGIGSENPKVVDLLPKPSTIEIDESLVFKIYLVNAFGEDVAFFVGDSTSVAVGASGGKFIPNCIYFTDDEVQFWSLQKKCGGHDMGVYHVKDQEIKQLYHGDDLDFRSDLCTPFWFFPRI